jgi:hypothetical protein
VTTAPKAIPNPQDPHHVMNVCAECGWPPALDGRCLCHFPQHKDEQGRFPDYAAHMLTLRARMGLDPPEGWN